MSDTTLYRATFKNDGTKHPNWKADGPISASATVAAESEDDAREQVEDYWRPEHGWEITGVEKL